MKTLQAKQHAVDPLCPAPGEYARPKPAGECDIYDCYAPAEVAIEHPNWDGPQEHCWVHALVYRKEDSRATGRDMSWRCISLKGNRALVTVTIDSEVLSQKMKFEGWPQWE